VPLHIQGHFKITNLYVDSPYQADPTLIGDSFVSYKSAHYICAALFT